MQNQQFNDTGLCNIRASQIGYIAEESEPAKLLETMKTSRGRVPCTTDQLVDMFSHFELPEAITDESFIECSENYKGSYTLVFNKQSHSGVWINIGDYGVWALTNGEYAWFITLDLDIAVGVPSIDGRPQLKMDPLK